jgi:uncharacterized protein
MKNCVARYLDLLEKSFVLFRLDGFSRNLHKEVSTMSTYDSFNDMTQRNDHSQVWEIFVVMEWKKHLAYSRRYANTFFWRSCDRKEIDRVEESEGRLRGWIETYPGAGFQVIHPENCLQFVTDTDQSNGSATLPFCDGTVLSPGGHRGHRSFLTRTESATVREH